MSLCNNIKTNFDKHNNFDLHMRNFDKHNNFNLHMRNGKFK